MKNRIIALLLCVVLLTCLMPAVAMAEEAEALQVKAFLSEDAIKADGKLIEDVWAKGQLAAPLTATGTAVTATAYHLYGAGMLYVAAEYTGATAMTLTVAGKTWAFDLSGAIATGDGVITGAAANGVLELAVKLNQAGIYLQNFNTTLPYAVTLSDGAETASLTADLLFSGDHVDGKLNELDKAGSTDYISLQADGSYVYL